MVKCHSPWSHEIPKPRGSYLQSFWNFTGTSTAGLYHLSSVHTRFIWLHFENLFVYAPNRWQTMLQCNIISYWLGTFTRLSPYMVLLPREWIKSNIQNILSKCTHCFAVMTISFLDGFMLLIPCDYTPVMKHELCICPWEWIMCANKWSYSQCVSKETCDVTIPFCYRSLPLQYVLYGQCWYVYSNLSVVILLK